MGKLSHQSMAKKSVKIPIKPYLFKYLQAIGVITGGVLTVQKRYYFPMVDNRHRAKAYFSRLDPTRITVTVITADPRQQYLFAMICYYKEQFEFRMLSYMWAREGLTPARTALQDFLDQYDIASDEYKIDTGYKKYYRLKLSKNEPT